jgi:hypothetical protein
MKWRKNSVILSLAFLVAAHLLAQPPATPTVTIPSFLKGENYQWIKGEDTATFKSYWAKVLGTDVIAMKGAGVVYQPMDKVASVIVDTSRGTEWIDSLMQSKVVREIKEGHFIEYDLVSIPFPFDTLINNRDFVSDTTVTYDRSKKLITVSYLPTEDAKAPWDKRYVRGTITCVFKIMPMSCEDQSWVEAEVHCDPRGGLAPWLVNFFQEGWPKTTFENLRRQCEKSDVKVVSLIADLMKEKPTQLAKKSR